MELKIYLLASLLVLVTNLAYGDSELREVYRSTRMSGMGGTGTGLADGDDAFYLNPAGLAGNKKYALLYGGLELTGSMDLYTSIPAFAALASNPSGDTVNDLMGQNIYGRMQYTPTIMMKNMALGFYLDGQTTFYARDKVYPQVTLGFQTTFGLQAGYGMTIAHVFKKRGEVRVGFNAKWMYRRGGYRPINMTKILAFSMQTINNEAGNYGRGIGADGGVQYVHTFSKKLNASVGVAYQDIGDTSFGDEPQANKGNLSIGGAFKYTVSKFTATTAVDWRHIREPTDWRKRGHIGLELGMPFFLLWGGINQVNLTYGGAIDLWFMRVSVSSYAEELGTFVFQDSNRRYVLRLDMKLNL